MRRDNKLLNNTQIRVMGIGNGGCNAVNRMVASGLQGIQFIAINMDNQSLAKSKAPMRIQIGKQVTHGLGTGGRPTMGRRAAYEASLEIKNALNGTDILFVTAGLGGGTGSGAAPVIAEMAQELNILTIAIVSRPSRFEGNEPVQIANAGIQELAKHTDALIVFPNDRLLSLSNKETSLTEAFQIANNVICRGVQVISEFVNRPGLINLDYANLKSILTKKGATLVTVGQASGIDKARIAAERALVCPMLGLSIHGARGMLINVTASSNMDLRETQEIATILKNTTHLDADFILGMNIDENMGDTIRVTVIATGFYNDIWDDKSYLEQTHRKSQLETMVHPEQITKKSSIFSINWGDYKSFNNILSA